MAMRLPGARPIARSAHRGSGWPFSGKFVKDHLPESRQKKAASGPGKVVEP
jgi:hypothetical protein